MLYHCLKRRPNIKTTLGRRFLFDRITTVILIVKSSTEKVITVHSKHSRLVQCWAFVFKTGHDLGKCNLNIKSSIYREIERPSQDNLPAFQAYSIHAMNGYQLTCNALTRHSNDMTIKPPPPRNVISAESITNKHIIQTCDYVTKKKTDLKKCKLEE